MDYTVGIKGSSRRVAYRLRGFMCGLLFFFFSAVFAQDDDITVHVKGGPWKSESGEVKLAKQSFSVRHAAGDVYFNGHIYMEPTIAFRTGNDGLSVSIKPGVTAKVTDEIPLPNTRVWLGYRLARQVMDYPDQSVRKIFVQFDKGSLIEYQGWSLKAPAGSTRVERLIVEWYSSDIDMQQKLAWGGAHFPWVAVVGAGITAGLGGAGLVWLRRRRARRKEEEDREKSDSYLIKFLALDPADELTEASLGQVLHIKVFPKKGGEDSEPPLNVMVNCPANGQTVTLKLTPENSTDKAFISEPLVLEWPQETLKLHTKKLKPKPGRLIRATVGEDYNSIRVAPMPDSDVPEFKGFLLERIGDGRPLLVNPDRNQNGHLGVRFTDPQGKPVVAEQIVWRIKGVDKAVITATDEQGETFLGFSPTDNRKFAAMFNDLLLARNIPVGRISVTAVPAHESFVGSMDSAPVTFKAKLTPPTMVSILNKSFKKAPILLDKHEYYVEAFLGGGLRGLIRPKTITAKVIEPDGGEDEVILTKSAMKWLYTSEVMQVAMDDQGDELCFEFNGQKTSVPVYSTEPEATAGEQRKLLESQGKIIAEALKADSLPADIRSGLQIKAKLVQNALIFHQQPFSVGLINIEIVNEYQKLLESEDFDFGQPIDVSPDQKVLPKIAKAIQVRYVCEAEQGIIDKTIDEQVKYQRSSLTVMDGVFIFLLETVRFVLSPMIGAYTLVSGRTEEGRKASFVERLAGGADALLCLLPIALGIRRYAKAAQAMRMQAKAELKFINRTLGQAHDQAIFTLNAVTATQLEARFAKMFRKSKKKSDSLLTKIEGVDKRVEKLRKQLADHQDELQKAQDKLAQMKAERQLPKAKRTEGIRTSPSAIASAERGIARRQRWMQGKQLKLDAALQQRKQATQALDQIKAGRYLDRQELLRMHEAGVRPGAFDNFDGVVANRIYEKQAEGAFAAKHGCWAGDNKVFIREPYKRTNWGSNFSVSKKVHVRHPEPDHLRLDPENFAAGDSKYYHWPEGDSLASMSRSNQRLVEGHVTTIVDTIEKARLCQHYLVSRTANFAGAPASKVWKEVLELPMVIVTPTNVPDFVQQMIKTRVRGAGRNVIFTRLEPQLDLWAELIPKIKQK